MIAVTAAVTEIDEVCVRRSPSFWLWTAISRKTGQVLGFCLGDRTRQMLQITWDDLPQDYRVKTDHLATYTQFFAAAPEQHEACDKGSGKTSRVEAWNTKSGECLHSLWRQRQSGLVRKSCGICHRILDDIYGRYPILVEQHNWLCHKKWLACQTST